MYMRPQLSRKRTSNREILSKEHSEDISTYNETLFNGMDFEADVEKISCLISDISNNDTLSNREKQSILQKLSHILSALKQEYSTKIQNKQADIEYSLKERIDEMESATRERQSEVFRVESTTWQTDVINKDKLVWESNKILQKYQHLLDKSRADLKKLILEAEEQRLRIKEHRTKR